MIKNFNWRKLVQPELLLFIGAIQSNLPYLLWKLGYPRPRAGLFSVSYRPLYLWIFAYIAFYFGTRFASLFFKNKINKKIYAPFSISPIKIRFYMLVTIILAVIQIILAIRLYGVLPILAYFSGYHASTLNAAQEESGFGQLGLLRLTMFILSGLILMSIVSNTRYKQKNKLLLRTSAIIVVGGSLFSGKTQGFFIFIFFLLIGGSLMGVNPINLIMRKFGFPKFSKRQWIIVMLSLFFFLIFLHGYTRFLRSGRLEEFNIKSSFDIAILYLSWPLMNMEKQTEILSLEDSKINFIGLVSKLLPFKIREDFIMKHDIHPPPRLEPTSPSGFLARPHWYLGLRGTVVFMFVIGAFCKYIYIKSNKSIFCLLAYSQIAWTLIAAHSYNHFFNLLFIPAPLTAFYILTKIVKLKVSMPPSNVRHSRDYND